MLVLRHGAPRSIRRARFEEQATLEGFDFQASPKLPAAQIPDLAALRWLHTGESVILYGPDVILGLSLWWRDSCSQIIDEIAAA